LLFLKKPIEIISIQLSFILGRGFFMKKFMALAALLLTAALMAMMNLILPQAAKT
jgi:hypothetical protein